jgi:hypothetical protein
VHTGRPREAAQSFYNVSVDAFLEAPITQENQRRCSLHRGGRSARGGRTVRDLVRGGGALWSGADGPRPGAGARVPCLTAGRSAPWGRTVRGLVRGGGALWSGADGPRPGAGARVPCLTAGRSAPWGRTVRAYAGAAEDRRRRLDLAPGRDPVGE